MPEALNLTTSWYGIAAVAIFVIAYAFVIFEESTKMRKSKPVLIAAGLIWALIGLAYSLAGTPEVAKLAAEHTISEYGELFLFLLVAITYVNAMEDRRVFDALRVSLTEHGFSYRILYWLIGSTAFCLSSALDNLTTALIMGSVALAVGIGNKPFVAITCISVVVAANAGGAYSPFGDITTLMVWQKGKLDFFEFFDLVIPAAVNWLVPAIIMHFSVPLGAPEPSEERVQLKPGAIGVMVLFTLTITLAVVFKNYLGLQPALGMMLGLGLLQLWSYHLQQKSKRTENADMFFDSFQTIARVEWDTLLFFFGIIFAVGGLGVLGYLAVLNNFLFVQWGATTANVVIGALSAIIDNIPLMYGVLTMNPDMSKGQWLLITLTAGVGGSLLSIGSAAGVALMGLARGHYTFSSHLKWTWAIALGYIASIATHLFINGGSF